MTADDILKYCLDCMDGTVLTESWGEKGIFYNPRNRLKRGVYVLTAKEKDGENDRSSRLDREDVFRINFGVRKSTFLKLFGTVPPRACKGGVVNMDFDFSALDLLMPHPVYAWMGWLCVLNPADSTFEQIKPLVREAYSYAQEKFEERVKHNITK